MVAVLPAVLAAQVLTGRLLATCYSLRTAYCLLPTTDYLPPTTYHLLPTVYCPLPTASCSVLTSCSRVRPAHQRTNPDPNPNPYPNPNPNQVLKGAAYPINGALMGRSRLPYLLP